MVERSLERFLFGSRWFLAPFYFLLALAVLLLFTKFVQEFVDFALKFLGASDNEAILAVLSLIDLTLMANLVVIVVFSGYESFVSKIDDVAGQHRPDWMGKIDFSGLKQKLMASIVAISAIQLLKAFMNVGSMRDADMAWLVGIHLTFVVSGVLLAVMDRLTLSAPAKSQGGG